MFKMKPVGHYSVKCNHVSSKLVHPLGHICICFPCSWSKLFALEGDWLHRRINLFIRRPPMLLVSFDFYASLSKLWPSQITTSWNHLFKLAYIHYWTVPACVQHRVETLYLVCDSGNATWYEWMQICSYS